MNLVVVASLLGAASLVLGPVIELTKWAQSLVYVVRPSRQE
jgi:hypothetical protein